MLVPVVGVGLDLGDAVGVTVIVGVTVPVGVIVGVSVMDGVTEAVTVGSSRTAGADCLPELYARKATAPITIIAAIRIYIDLFVIVSN